MNYYSVRDFHTHISFSVPRRIVPSYLHTFYYKTMTEVVYEKVVALERT